MNITIWECLLLLLIAAICGGCLVAIAVGFIGALIGTWLQRATGAEEIFAIQVGGTTFPIVWSIIGGVLFALVVSLLTPRYPRTSV
jgi:uncharacterized membrane protein YeaQ/YmgE (transglycosylase-associated protein family)